MGQAFILLICSKIYPLWICVSTFEPCSLLTPIIPWASLILQECQGYSQGCLHPERRRGVFQEVGLWQQWSRQRDLGGRRWSEWNEHGLKTRNWALPSGAKESAKQRQEEVLPCFRLNQPYFQVESSYATLKLDLPLGTGRRHHRFCCCRRGALRRCCSCPAVLLEVLPVVLHLLLLILPITRPKSVLPPLTTSHKPHPSTRGRPWRSSFLQTFWSSLSSNHTVV